MQENVLLEPQSMVDAAELSSALESPSAPEQPECCPSAEAIAIDLPDDRMALQRLAPLGPGSVLVLEFRNTAHSEKYYVRQYTRNGANHSIQLQRDPLTQNETESESPEPDYYDILQIRTEADPETIHRVYRIMAARFHPDNPETGDIDRFLLLKTAYEVLSNPALRGEYDGRHKKHDAEPMPIFEMKDFVTGVEAEANRRLGVLSLLYNQRRVDADHPGISLLDLEHRMAFPREYLNFTMWYLRSKSFVTAADNSDYALTAPGADFVEANIAKSEFLGKLLFHH